MRQRSPLVFWRAVDARSFVASSSTDLSVRLINRARRCLDAGDRWRCTAVMARITDLFCLTVYHQSCRMNCCHCHSRPSSSAENITVECALVLIAAGALQCTNFFYRATRMHSANYAAARCLSVRLSVCPSVSLSVTRRYCV